MQILKRLPKRFNLTVDIWTAPNMKAYIAMGAHFFQSSQPVKYMYCFRLFDESHTGENIARMITVCGFLSNQIRSLSARSSLSSV